MKISDFQSALQRHGGVQRQHRWRVILNLPPTVASADLIKDMSLTAITTQLPPSTLGEILIPYAGREIPLPGDRKFEPFPITFIGVEDDAIHEACEVWSELFNGTESNTQTGALEDLMVDVELQLLREDDSVIRSYFLEGSWPQEVGSLELDKQSQDSFSQFTLTLRYIQHTHNKTL